MVFTMTHLKPAAILALGTLVANHSASVSHVRRAIQVLGEHAPNATELVRDMANLGLVTVAKGRTDATTIVTATDTAYLALVIGTV